MLVKKLKMVTLAAGLAFSATALAQVGSIPVGSVVPTAQLNTGGADPLRALIQTNPGAYINCPSTGQCEFSTTDNTPTQLAITTWLRNVHDETRNRYEDLVKQTLGHLNDLVNSVYAHQQGAQPDGLITLSNASQAGTYDNNGSPSALIPVDKIYGAFADFQQRQLVVKQDFALLSTYFAGGDSGIDIQDKGVLKQNVPQYATQSIAALKTGLTASLNAVTSLVCGAKFNLQFLTGASIPEMNATPIQCAAPDTDGNVIASLQITNEGVLMSKADMDGIREKIKRLKRPPSSTTATAKKMFEQVRQLIMTFTKVWGEDEARVYSTQSLFNRWFSLPDARLATVIQGSLEQRQEAYDRLTDYMWLRSALRLTWGLPLGAFDIHYVQDKGWAGAKALFMTKYATLTQIPETPILDQDPIEAALEKATSGYFTALNTAESKSSEILSGDSSLVDKVNTGISVWQGNDNTWKALNMVIKLMAEDFYEERALWGQGGLTKVNDMYAARYVNVDGATRKRFLDLKKNFNNVIMGLGADSPDDGDDLADVNFAKDNSIRGSGSDLSVELQNWLTQISQIRALQIQLNIATQARTTIELKKAQQRANQRL